MEKDANAVVYDVLYYKRTNKVHKSKGVSKMDGKLTVHLPPVSKVVLRDDNGDVDASSEDEEETTKVSWKERQRKNRSKAPRGGVLVSSIQREIASKAQADELQEDDIVTLGAYDVQILSRQTLPKTETRQQTPARSPFNNTKEMTKRVVPVAKPRLAASTALKTSSVLVRRPPAQPKKGSLSLSPKSSPPMATNQSKQPVRKPLQSKSVLASKNTVAATAGDTKALLPAKRPLSTTTSRTIGQKQPKKQSTLPSSSASSVLPEIPLPASIRSVLRPHQITGIDFLYKTLTGPVRGSILADEMGLGKTLMTVGIICALHRTHRDKQFVVVCPSSLVLNWSKEFDKWIGKASQPKRVVIQRGGEEGLQQIRAYFGSMKQQQSLHKKQSGQVLIISYDLFRMNAKQFQSLNTSAGLLVVDEGHRLKNKNGSLTLTALESLPSDARLCLTATPIQNNLSEFFSLANFVSPGILGDLSCFAREYERPIAAANRKGASREQRERGLGQSKQLEQITKTFVLRRLQKDVLKTMLPPRTEALLFCKPSPEQCRLYQLIANQSRGSCSGSLSDALTALTKLRKVCSHPQLATVDNDDDDDNLLGNADDATGQPVSLSGKLQVLDALVQSIRTENPEDKVVIVSNFTSALSLIESLVLKPRQLSYLRLDGTVELPKRQSLVGTFNRSSAERTFCFLLSSKAGGCGLNLIGANRLVMFDADWNPASDIQAMGRVYRQGQTKPCTIYRFFTAGTVEEVIYQRQSQKGGLAALTVDGQSSNATGKFTKEELADCFTLKRDCVCDTKRKVGSVWPSYSGPDDLVAMGCTDEPLFYIAQAMPEKLGHVHIVNDDDQTLPAFDSDGEEESSAMEGLGEGDGSSSNEKEFESSGDEEEFE